MSCSRFSAVAAILCWFGLFPFLTQSSPGYVFEHNNYIYKFVFPEDDIRTWYEAETLCKTQENGHLTSLVSNNEITWVDGIIRNIVRDPRSKVKFWIGGSDRRITDVWDFVDGQPLRYNVVPWAPGQPERPLQHVHYGFCVNMEFEGGSSRWFVDDCFEAYGYICKSEEPPPRLTQKKRFGYSWEWGNYIYKFIPLPWNGLSWSEAERYCKEMERGHLLSIRTLKESRWVTDRIRQIRRVLGFSKFWIGASDFGHQGVYEWTDKKKPVTFTRWAPGEPSFFAKNRKEDCVAIHADPDWGKWSDESCVMETPFACKTRLCLGKTDLAFIVDSSESVSEGDFQEAKNFVWEVISNFEISGNDTRVGVIRYSTQATVIFDFQFSADNNILLLKETIDNIPFVEGGTKTERALQLAPTDLFSTKGGSRPEVPKILVVVTDGKSENALGVARASMALKQKHVTILAVGIGEEVDMEELLLMASTADDVIRVSTFSALKKQVAEIRDKVCDEMFESQNRKQLEEDEKQKNEEN
ncbi:hypothetical protein ACROYT_G039355 [Oculina patagonica]